MDTAYCISAASPIITNNDAVLGYQKYVKTYAHLWAYLLFKFNLYCLSHGYDARMKNNRSVGYVIQVSYKRFSLFVQAFTFALFIKIFVVFSNHLSTLRLLGRSFFMQPEMPLIVSDCLYEQAIQNNIQSVSHFCCFSDVFKFVSDPNLSSVNRPVCPHL